MAYLAPTSSQKGPRVLVCGGWNYQDVEAVFTILDRLAPSFVLTGRDTGAGGAAIAWCETRGRTPWYCDIANFDVDGKAAGYRRNERMLEQGDVDLVIAFPSNDKQTSHLTTLATKRWIPVLRFEQPLDRPALAEKRSREVANVHPQTALKHEGEGTREDRYADSTYDGTNGSEEDPSDAALAAIVAANGKEVA